MTRLPANKRNKGGKGAGKKASPKAEVVAHNVVKVTKMAAAGTKKRMKKTATKARRAAGSAIKKVGRAVGGDAGKRGSKKDRKIKAMTKTMKKKSY